MPPERTQASSSELTGAASAPPSLGVERPPSSTDPPAASASCEAGACDEGDGEVDEQATPARKRQRREITRGKESPVGGIMRTRRATTMPCSLFGLSVVSLLAIARPSETSRVPWDILGSGDHIRGVRDRQGPRKTATSSA